MYCDNAPLLPYDSASEWFKRFKCVSKETVHTFHLNNAYDVNES
jgi:hypothetical protein